MKPSESKYCHCLYFSAAALARKVEKLATASWKEVDLSPSHAYLLMMALEQPGLQPGCIADHLQLSPSTVTRLIEKLEEKALLSRTTEGKLTFVHPTEKAQSLQDRLHACTQSFRDRCKNMLGEEESRIFVEKLQSIADRITG